MTADRTYEVRITGLVAPQVLVDLPDVEVATQELRTVLRGEFEDQAALYGFLHQLRALGLEVVEVRRVSAAGKDLPADPAGTTHDPGEGRPGTTERKEP